MKQLQTIDADTLLSTPLPVTKFIVDGLLPEGLHILAGSPKVGKSWLALWICFQVSKGDPVWELPTARGTVLYLCLEDSYSRIQSRLFQITDDAPDTLHFANLSESIGDGLEKQITSFLFEHPDTNLIVIDTLQKIRGIIPDKNSYANDYRDLSSLKNLADHHHLAILLVHHLRKMKGDDPMNMISGTTGLSGATDSNFVLKRKDRSSPHAELHCTGRDIESRVLELCFQKETHTWELAKPIESERVAEDKQKIEQRAVNAGMTVTDYLTTCALGKRIVRVDGLDIILAELKAQGRNLNQLTVLANMGRVTVVRGDELAGSYAYLCDEIYRLAQEVR